MPFKIDSAEISLDDIMTATMGAIEYARANYGEEIDARSIDLRLWAAAALINSAIQVSVKPAILRSLNEKLEMYARANRIGDT